MTQTEPAAELRYTVTSRTAPHEVPVVEVHDHLTNRWVACFFQHLQPSVDAPALAAQLAAQLNAEHEQASLEALRDELVEDFARSLQALTLAQLQGLKRGEVSFQTPRHGMDRLQQAYDQAVHRSKTALGRMAAKVQDVSAASLSPSSEPSQPEQDAPLPERPLGPRTKLDEFKPGWYAGEDGTVTHYETFPFAPIVGPFPSESAAAQHSAPYRQRLVDEAFRAAAALVPLAGKVCEGQKLRQAQGEQLLAVLKAIEEADTQDATSVRVLISHLPTRRVLMDKGFQLDHAPTRGLEQSGEWLIVSWKDA